MRLLILLATALATVGTATTAEAFCGFYVARADTGLYNRASQVAGPINCDAGDYRVEVHKRQEREAQTLANLTGWDLEKIRSRIEFMASAGTGEDGEPWWKRLWN